MKATATVIVKISTSKMYTKMLNNLIRSWEVHDQVKSQNHYQNTMLLMICWLPVRGKESTALELTASVSLTELV